MRVDESTAASHAGVRAGSGSALPWHILLLLAAFAAGVVAQGGFYPPGRLLVTGLAGAALLVAVVPLSAWSWRDCWWVPAAGVALGGWALARAAVEGRVVAGLPTVAVLVGVVAGVLVLQRADADLRTVCAATMVGVGVLVAVSGWIGVAWRVPTLASTLEEDPARRIWRAASTLTYANAAAGLLAVLTILGMALLLTRPRSPVWQTAVYLLLVGLGATLSRADSSPWPSGWFCWRYSPALVGWSAPWRRSAWERWWPWPCWRHRSPVPHSPGRCSPPVD